MKKRIVLILVTLLCLNLAGCGFQKETVESLPSETVNSFSQENELTASKTESNESKKDESKKDESKKNESKKNESKKSESKTSESKVTECNHSFTNATCTSAAVCKKCGKTSGSALGHSYSGGNCKNCGKKDPDYTYSVETPVSNNHTHYYSSSTTKEATCGEEGVKTFKCSCGDSYTEAISKKSYHDWEYATCTAPKTCKVCGKTEGEATEHSYYSDGKCGECKKVNPIIEETLAKCSLKLPSLPVRLHELNYDDEIKATFNVTDITYKFECNNDGEISLTAWFSGSKVFDDDGSGQSDVCSIGWKLYDENGNVVKSDTFYSPGLAMGETFSNKEECIFWSSDDIAPGAYRLEILNTN